MKERMERVGEWLRKWGIFLAAGAFFIAVLIFILTAGNSNKGKTAHYTNGTLEVEIDGVRYELINDVDGETYIGSMVSDALKAERGEKVGTVTSYGIMTVAVLYRVSGDETGELLIDARGRIYAKSGTEEKYAALTAEECFTDYRMAVGAKTYDTLADIEDAIPAEVLKSLKEYTEGTSEGMDNTVRIDDPLVSEKETNRRELFVFTEDGMFYKAALELFQYNGHVYVTSGYTDNGDDAADVLFGLRVSEEAEEYFLKVWDGKTE